MASVRSQSVAELVLCTVGRPGRRTSSSAVHSAVLIGVVGRAVGVVGLVVKTDDGLEAVFSELQKTFLHERVGDGSRPGGMVCSWHGKTKPDKDNTAMDDPRKGDGSGLWVAEEDMASG
ncbi:hypothetical protein G6F46_002185 [Rhizopus delemar]|uniref:Uncharacterized protein n=2 Tax=Rhizopus TaxID=4842 RepID=A0A9P6Z556_9FUNG|nr:hypothetical protein G6F55_003958 [Rhizopus delemar]KAG1550760.1 hypothetical protein G6F51_002259 [Rhizopus arrhizus]KAG1499124.1 hypothetical protein G6F54_004621 [Rhizopus delemar]KAG1512790.1 hypothetical protein G6F53_004913 [Rhizopus delemar]KAG1526401.1 hypothetical protein G6F52_002468 [Rhizopus delemar]